MGTDFGFKIILQAWGKGKKVQILESKLEKKL